MLLLTKCYRLKEMGKCQPEIVHIYFYKRSSLDRNFTNLLILARLLRLIVIQEALQVLISSNIFCVLAG